MQIYQFSGINRYGERVRGQIEGKNQAEVEQKLQASKIDILSLKPKGRGLKLFKQTKITRKEIIAITFQFEQLLRAGVPLMEILADLRDSFENHAVKEMLDFIYQSMEGGETFSHALQSYRDVFGDVYISLVSVGEQTGQLEVILADLANMLKWEDELLAKAKKVMIYPAIVSLVVLGVVLLMMVFVVPELLGFISQMGGELGASTRALIATSSFIQNNILFLLAAPFVLVFIFKAWLKRSEMFRIQFDKAKFKIKIIGPVLYKLKIARLANSLAVMYSAGMSFTESMKLASKVVDNTYMEKNVLMAIRLIKEGEPIHQAFATANVFPPLGVRMVKVGERSGQMDESLKNVSYFYDREAKESIEKIEPAIEPLLTIIMAVIVGWVMMAVLGPVYDTITQVQF
ncbi:MAG: type II secretion system F family protein [Thiomicrospira sp.]|uniref:type II secretion system F family protein n=1 Tax=Thiomicrospira sp. TaxID=935 RepID=UPI0019D9F91C|nr:type II secretion system F family protein [Thiomicrospira sp.]MBE0492948.1 type II secretion system F family protein [Thiomicrospira sp.]